MVLDTHLQWIGAIVWASLAFILNVYSCVVYYGITQHSRKKRSGRILWRYRAFRLLLLLLYILTWLSIFIYWRSADGSNAIYNSTLTMYTLQTVLMFLWLVNFIIVENNIISLTCIFLVFILSTTWIILYAVQQQWIAFTLAVPYVLWIIVMLAFTAHIFGLWTPKQKKKVINHKNVNYHKKQHTISKRLHTESIC